MVMAASSPSDSVFVILCFLFLSSLALATKYQEDDNVTLWANVVGPYNNPQETYSFYSLPYCRPSGVATKNTSDLGVLLKGNQLIDTQVDIKFKRDIHRISLCEVKLDAAAVKLFKDAISSSYWFELFLDDLPLWGFIGHEDYYNKVMIYTHWNIAIHYNGEQIIHVNFSQENPKPLEKGRQLNMTYSVNWIPTDTKFSRRFDVYLDHRFFEHQVHWFSIFNSLVMVVFLAGLVSKILMRTLCTEDGKHAREDIDLGLLEKELVEESGWKLLHGDVFRPPQNLALFSAIVGTGVQLMMLVFLLIIFAIFGRLYMWRGAITTAFLYCYALTSFVLGYTSGAIYFRYGGEKWKKAMILTAFLFPCIGFAISSILDIIAMFYGSLAPIPSNIMVVALAIWAFISLPLVVVGTLVGRNFGGAPNDPCRTNTIPRPIPEKRFYLTRSVICLMGGVLPFGSIFVEIYFVFTCLWNYKIYYLYGVLLLVFIILIIVTIFATILGTYMLLNAENHHWQWTSFLAGASIAIYIFLYSIYYYHVKTRISSFIQASIYFGSTLMLSLGLGILCGAVGYVASNLFVRWIYRNIKCE
ncbi:hypothetical protein M9H77_24678 [Catharanthus roseus]|uniref:Uncharacterized protein n=1 Tax=Catharanthus roseus TaxID=4058 RepID=A0ACC0A4Q3_CATRO|nr:hypothetical protein M9H77_24678 [Catharanthus roseus]